MRSWPGNQNVYSVVVYHVPASLVAQSVKNLPEMRETGVRSLGWQDSLEKEMTNTPVFLPGESHGQRSLAGYSPWGHKGSDTTEATEHIKQLIRYG